jgi:protein tyrosine phosphatase (PTP) superfamily phosphohydrolase (DUF442 family)
VAVFRRAKVAAGIILAGVLGTGCVSPSNCSPREITPGIFQGSKPITAADYARLHQQGIRTILSLETMTCHIEPERKLARENGLGFRNVPILPSPLEPNERRVREALATLNDRSFYPIFVHCYTGVDRTTFITGLYRVYYLGWTPEAAWEDMLHVGFHPRWWLVGFKTLFWEHTKPSTWAKAPPSTSHE